MTGTELQRLRRRAGLTQHALATALGMHANTVAQMERDELPIRTVVALAVAHVVRCSVPQPKRRKRDEREA